MRRCPNCGFYNFDVAESCGRCETLLANTNQTKGNQTKAITFEAKATIISQAQESAKQPIAAEPPIKTIIRPTEAEEPAVHAASAAAPEVMVQEPAAHAESAATPEVMVQEPAAPAESAATPEVMVQEPAAPAESAAAPVVMVQEPAALIKPQTVTTTDISEKPLSPQKRTTAQKLARLQLELATLPPLPAGQEGNIANELPQNNLPEETEELLAEDTELPLLTANKGTNTLSGVSDKVEESIIEATLPSSFRRFCATVIDTFLALAILMMVLFCTLSGTAIFGNGVSNFYGVDRLADLLANCGQAFVLAFIITPAVAWLYQTLLVSLCGGTLGHLLSGLKVTSSKTGKKPGFGSAMLRGLFLVLGTCCCGLGIYWRCFDSLRRDWGDLFASTVVVKK